MTQYSTVRRRSHLVLVPLFLPLALVLLAACPPARPVRPRPRPTPRAVETFRFVAPEAYRQFVLSELARGRGDASRALDHLRLALAEDPASPYLRLRIAELLIGQLPSSA